MRYFECGAEMKREDIQSHYYNYKWQSVNGQSIFWWRCLSRRLQYLKDKKHYIKIPREKINVKD